MANANGRERFVTVGCSHITQFCKVAMVGGITSRSKLQIEGTSQLDVPKLKRNANFRIMIEQGWQWYIFPSELDDKYPAFAKLSQRALNSANNCRQTCSEIELACQIVEFHNAALANGAEDPKSSAIDAAQEDLTSCTACAKVLLDYA